MSDDPLTPADIDRAAAATATAPDYFLVRLVELAVDGFDLRIGVLTNGMIVTGRLGRSADAAADIDAELRRCADRLTSPPDGQSAEQWTDVLTTFATQMSRAVDSSERERKEVKTKIDAHYAQGDTAPLPGELHRRHLYQRACPALTILDAQIASHPTIHKPEQSRASASIERPFSAARTRRRAFSPSSRLRTVNIDVSPHDQAVHPLTAMLAASGWLDAAAERRVKGKRADP